MICLADGIIPAEIAGILVELGKTRFEKIGGMNTAHELMPTVEGTKFFNGRVSACLSSNGR